MIEDSRLQPSCFDLLRESRYVNTITSTNETHLRQVNDVSSQYDRSSTRRHARRGVRTFYLPYQTTSQTVGPHGIRIADRAAESQSEIMSEGRHSVEAESVDAAACSLRVPA